MRNPLYRLGAVCACLSVATLLLPVVAAAASETPSGRFLPVQESLSRFVMPPGYFMEAALTDPVIAEPVDIVFDGDGRMFVAEMRSYMQDVDGSDERAPISRISLHEDRDGDGVYETHADFADGLVLPRMMLPLRKGELLVNETDTQDIYLYRDTDGDGVSDQKSLWFEGGSRGGNLEHQQSGLVWALDNWIYMTINPWRLRWNGYDRPPLQEETAPNGGQWGLSQDDLGKLWFINAGGEIGPLNFQIPIIYGRLSLPGELSDDFRTVYPLPTLPDMQAGPRQMRPEDGTLNHFTATCGGEIYRGDRLPWDLRGDLFFSEPVGRLIRQTRVETRDGVTHLSNAYPGSEFIRSSDPNFRTVNLKTAPDGTLYLVDMQHGIIQEAAWVGEGSYLRRVVDQFDLDKNVLHGRVYRLRHEAFESGPAPRMFEETSAELVAHLAHPNGWWRDTAQRLLILRGDTSVKGALESMARNSANPLARIHALWTLEGLRLLSGALVSEALKAGQPPVRVAALRMAESLARADSSREELVPAIRELVTDPDPEVAIQAMLTDRRLEDQGWKERVQAAATAHRSEGVHRLMDALLNPVSTGVAVEGFTPEVDKRLAHGEAIYNELCFACHGADGRGMRPEGAPAGFTLAPPFAGSRTLLGHSGAPIAVLLKGLTGPVNGKSYEAQMVPMANNDDAWIADVLSYVRTHFGNRASTIDASEVAGLRSALEKRGAPFTQKELQANFPQRLTDRSKWKASASHLTENAGRLVDRSAGSRWESQASQEPGMWCLVDMAKPERIAGLHLDTPARFESGYPRALEVSVSLDGETWKSAGTATGNGPLVEVRFAPVDARFVRLSLTVADAQFWVIGDLQVYEAALQEVEMKAAPQAAKGFE